MEVEIVVISEEEEGETMDATTTMMMLQDEMEDDLQQLQQGNKDRTTAADSLITLESFKFLRVLLVEFDDSTRSIIGALLRKSGYRVVSVADGLKAWEILKDRPQTIDLVLAEVELPSISGFSLLTMIMGDDICRNIPVIMMSSYDAVNVVFKCMMRGAADFLVKPVRKNELRNLWQHVWRRNSVANNVGHTDKNCNPSQQKLEAIDETSSTKSSNHCVPSLKEHKECSEKGTDEQSSCTKPDMEDDTIDVKNMQNLSEPKSRNVSSINSMNTLKGREFLKVDNVLLTNEIEVKDKSVRLNFEGAPCNQSNYLVELITEEENAEGKLMSQGKDSAPETQQEDANLPIDSFYRIDEQLKPSREAMDLIGSFDNYTSAYNARFQEPVPNNSNVFFDPNSTKNNCGSTPQLELSLRRCQFNDNEIQGVDEIQTLKHSNTSAFSRYNTRIVQPPVCSESEECVSASHKHQSDHALSHTAEVPQHGVISVPVPVRSTGIDAVYPGYGAVWPQFFYTPVGPLPLQNSHSITQQEAVCHVYSSDQSHPEKHDYQHSNRKSTNTTMHEKRHNVESFDDSRHVSAATTQSVASSLCNSSSSNINSSGCGSVCDGSNGNETAVAVSGSTTGHGNDIGVFMPDGVRGADSLCSNQREAALTKFRLKRKDRCFEKKVRYQSRKRLAEQRPRVKGQFVRQISS